MNRIKNLRESQYPKMSQEKLAQLVGVGRTTVTMWERGTNEPDNATLIKLAEIFHVSTDYLLGYEGKNEKPPIVSDEGQADKLAKALQDIGIDVDALSDTEINRIARLAKAALEE